MSLDTQALTIAFFLDLPSFQFSREGNHRKTKADVFEFRCKMFELVFMTAHLICYANVSSLYVPGIQFLHVLHIHDTYELIKILANVCESCKNFFLDMYKIMGEI